MLNFKYIINRTCLKSIKPILELNKYLNETNK